MFAALAHSLERKLLVRIAAKLAAHQWETERLR